MRKLMLVCGVLALGACAEAAEEAPVEDAAMEDAAVEEVAAVVGVYEGTTDDGEAWSATIDADGTSTVMMGEEVVDTATWRTDETGQTCFTDTMLEEGEEAEEQCYVFGEVGEDGAIDITDDEGEVNTITKVS